ncbi:MAG: beta-galactosidase GalA [Bacteroidota bacterium]
MKLYSICSIAAMSFLMSAVMAGQPKEQSSPREKLLMDFGWRFALGHAYDTKKDFDNGSGYFSYFAKTGYGDGAASKNFDDRGWRILDLPHDWCVELPFDSLGSYSHGYKAMGRNFPQNSVGWYRKKFSIPESDLGRRIYVEFDGVFRNSIVWVNGFYLGTEHSGYVGFSYDISDYLNYGGDNVIAVRVDATMEEGWFYEGAGIYRHVWLTKVSPLHVVKDGTFVTTDLEKNTAVITARTTITNESMKNQTFNIDESIVDSSGKTIASGSKKGMSLKAGNQEEYISRFNVLNPTLWSVENPYLHKLKTVIRSGGKIVDTYETTFGIRTVRFDPNEGFFLNGKHLEIKGTDDHQDHAGVGIAIPDALQEFRVKRLKEMGSNAIRTAHNPPAPELLDACDRLGMLVLDENRLMGINQEHLDCLERFMKRDRNHPSVVLWSLGNEEWAIEGNIKGARVGTTMQAFAQRLDSSRAFTAAISGGWDDGTGMVMQVMGYNYIVQGDIDEHHKKFPWQAGIGTEESNTVGTRGIYVSDDSKAHMAPRTPENAGTEVGWKFYSARPFLSGLFYWTGFDYRGEMNPYDWPAVSSQYGILDLCGFPKDIFYYLQSWWGKDPVLHIVPDWIWKGHEGQESKVTVYSNCDEVELLLNNKSLGMKEMPHNGHLEWMVSYQPGILSARGYNTDETILESRIDSSGSAASIQLIPDRDRIKADGEDVSVITVQVTDHHGVTVPNGSNKISFSVDGPGKIIGVGNGDPSCHEADKYFETVKTTNIQNLKELAVNNLNNRPEVAAGFNDSTWKPALRSLRSDDWRVYADTLLVIRGTFELPALTDETEVNLFTKSIVENQSVYVNGRLLASNIKRDDPNQSFRLDHKILKPGKNEYAVVGQRFRKASQWDEPNTDPGLVQTISPPAQWQRSVFNGLAQVIVQSTKQQGEITVKASAEGLQQAETKIQTYPVTLRSALPSE